LTLRQEVLDLKLASVLACSAVLLVGFYGVAQSTASAPKQNTPAATASPPAPAGAGAPKINAQKEADIRRLIAITGAAQLGIQMMEDMETNLRPVLESSLPPGEYRHTLIELFFQKFRSKARQESLVAMVVPIYDRHFSDEELKGLIAFYESPVGKKAVEVLPQVMDESREAGSRWG
jgi:hypothetical protein